MRQLYEDGALNVTSAGPPCGVVIVGGAVVEGAVVGGMGLGDELEGPVPPEQAASAPTARHDARSAVVRPQLW